MLWVDVCICTYILIQLLLTETETTTVKCSPYNCSFHMAVENNTQNNFSFKATLCILISNLCRSQQPAQAVVISGLCVPIYNTNLPAVFDFLDFYLPHPNTDTFPEVSILLLTVRKQLMAGVQWLCLSTLALLLSHGLLFLEIAVSYSLYSCSK